MLKTRVLSALLGIPLIIFILYSGGLYLYLFTAAVSLTGLFEYYRALSNININTNKNSIGSVGIDKLKCPKSTSLGLMDKGTKKAKL